MPAYSTAMFLVFFRIANPMIVASELQIQKSEQDSTNQRTDSIEHSLKSFYLSTQLAFASKQARLANRDEDDIPRGGTPSWIAYNLYPATNIKIYFFE